MRDADGVVMMDPEYPDRPLRFEPKEAVAAIKLAVAMPRQAKEVLDVKVVEAPPVTQVRHSFGVSPDEEEARREAAIKTGLVEEDWT